MKIGARTHDFAAASFPEVLQLIKGIGYETIQLAPAKAIAEIKNIHSIEPGHIESIRRELEKAAMHVSVLGCYIEPSINDREQRLSNVAAFRRNIGYAKILGTLVVGTETTHFPMPDEASREKAYQNLKDSVERMAETAEKEGIIIGMEPVAEHTMNDPEITRRLIDEVGSDKIRVIFDPSNLLLPETTAKQQAVFQRVYDLLGDYIEVVHVKDFVIANGAKQMCALGEGVVDFPAIFKWLKENRPDVPLLRENSRRESDAADIAYMKNYW